MECEVSSASGHLILAGLVHSVVLPTSKQVPRSRRSPWCPRSLVAQLYLFTWQQQQPTARRRHDRSSTALIHFPSSGQPRLSSDVSNVVIFTYTFNITRRRVRSSFILLSCLCLRCVCALLSRYTSTSLSTRSFALSL